MLRVFDAFEFHAKNQPEALFSEDDSSQITYAEAHVKVVSLKSALIDSGVVKGDRVVILSRNSMEVLLLFYALSSIGAVPVPVNVRLTAADWAWIVSDSNCRLVLGELDFLTALKQEVGENEEPIKFVSFEVNDVGVTSLREWQNTSNSENKGWNVVPSDTFLQVYTSGTTGRPKGVVLSHENSIAQASSFIAGVGNIFPGPQKCLQSLPLFHIGGIFVSLVTVYCGGCVVFRKNFNPEEQLNLLGRGDVSSCAMVPAMMAACLAVPGKEDKDYSALNLILYGASPISDPVLRQSNSLFKCGFVQVYGMTETHSMITLLGEIDHAKAISGEGSHLIKSCGRPAPGTEVKIWDENGVEQEVGQRGELVVRAPQVMTEYWRRPQATEESLIGGWLRTGDAAYRDEDGYFYVVDRIKDLIISGGENISPSEVEVVIRQVDGIADVSVIGIPDDKWGEAVAAIVVLEEGAQLSAQDILNASREKLAGFKLPKVIKSTPDLPRNAAGKVLKTKLRQPFWEGRERGVS